MGKAKSDVRVRPFQRTPGGPWTYRIRVNGKQCWRTRHPGTGERLTTEAKALAAWAWERAQLDNGGASYVAPSKKRFGALLDRWLAQNEKKVTAGALSATTSGFYESISRVHLRPVWGDMVVQKIGPAHIESLILSARGAGASASTARNVYAVARLVFEAAVRWGELATNPCARVDQGVMRKERRTGEAPAERWTREELSTFLDAMREDRWWVLWVVLSMTGMRRGEALALRWADVDLEAGTIAITKARVRLSSGPVEQAPKTSDSHRTAPIGPFVIAALRELRARSEAERDHWNELWEEAPFGEGDHVFSLENGQPIDPPSATKWFARRVTKAGVPKIRLHQLRHTHASILLDSGTPLASVRSRLGHSVNSTLTLSRYARHAEGGEQGRLAAEVAEQGMETRHLRAV